MDWKLTLHMYKTGQLSLWSTTEVCEGVIVFKFTALRTSARSANFAARALNRSKRLRHFVWFLSFSAAMEEQSAPKAQHQKSYPVEFKLQVLDWYYSNGKNKLKTATHFNIHTKRIRDWELNEAFLRAHSDSPRRRFRMEKAAADMYGNIGKSLFQWYVEEKAVGTEHSFGDLKSQAVQLATELNAQESFTVSDSWIRRWKKKYGVEDAGTGGRRRAGGRAVLAAAMPSGCEEGVVEVETGTAGNLLGTGEHGEEVITLPAILQVEVSCQSSGGASRAGACCITAHHHACTFFLASQASDGNAP